MELVTTIDAAGSHVGRLRRCYRRMDDGSWPIATNLARLAEVAFWRQIRPDLRASITAHDPIADYDRQRPNWKGAGAL
jgi:hypothetical protein